MDIPQLIQHPINVVTLIAVLALVVERLITGGWLRLIVGKKAGESESQLRRRHDDEVSADLLVRMGALETHFNHETTEQYRTVIEGQKDILDILRRIERDGIRIKG